MENNVIKMVERFGEVCYWMGCLGVLIAFPFGYDEAPLGNDGKEDRALNVIVGLFYAVPVWLAGFWMRYILTGRWLLKKREDIS
ncbi:MAG: hypothetical protein DYH13_05260 [Alphaproteobacteria bacterium PRO2]|nr:hypothetical protein [Alphaproteobacteria bacterium PRO2]